MNCYVAAVLWSSHISITTTLCSLIQFSFETKTQNRSLAGPTCTQLLGRRQQSCEQKIKESGSEILNQKRSGKVIGDLADKERKQEEKLKGIHLDRAHMSVPFKWNDSKTDRNISVM